MCKDLESAIEAQETLGSDTTKGALLLTKATLKSIKQQSAAMEKMAKDFKTHCEESGEQMSAMQADIKTIKEIVHSFSADATKWQLIVQICKTLFGDTKRCILTTVWVALILGAVHFKDIIELLKAII